MKSFHGAAAASIVGVLGGLVEDQAQLLEALAVAAHELGGVAGIAFDGMPDIAV